MVLIWAELLQLLQEGFAGWSGEPRLSDRLLDLGGMVVDRLSAAGDGLGLLGDGAVAAAEDGGGIADPGEQR